jgi:hypothetical protein
MAGRGTTLRWTLTRQQLWWLGNDKGNDELRVLLGADEELRLCSTVHRGAA